MEVGVVALWTIQGDSSTNDKKQVHHGGSVVSSPRTSLVSNSNMM
jgi:hypothetical protein